MTIDELKAIFSQDIAQPNVDGVFLETKASVTVPLLSGAPALPLRFFTNVLSFDDVLPALATLLSQAKSPELDQAMSNAIYAEYREVADFLVKEIGDYTDEAAMIAYHAEGRGFADVSPPAVPDDMWRLIKWNDLYVDRSFDGLGVNVVICGQTAWDIEHEIGLFFRDGKDFLTASDPSLAI